MLPPAGDRFGGQPSVLGKEPAHLGVIGIYGVQGEEDRFIDVFTPKWFEMFNHAVTEGKRLGVNIDLTPGSGWRLGGPHITSEHAEQSFSVENGQLRAKNRSDKVKRAGPGGKTSGLTRPGGTPSLRACSDR